jgi:hypothetical protein
LLQFAAVLDGYDGEQMVRRRETVTDGSQEATIQEMMRDPLIRYVMVLDGKAGCFDLRVERKEES